MFDKGERVFVRFCSEWHSGKYHREKTTNLHLVQVGTAFYPFATSDIKRDKDFKALSQDGTPKGAKK